MPRYFLDTSALVKLYRSEAGSASIDRLFSEPASQHLISRLLSIALGLKRAGLVAVFVAADQRLCRVAAFEGFAVTNPEQPPSVMI